MEKTFKRFKVTKTVVETSRQSVEVVAENEKNAIDEAYFSSRGCNTIADCGSRDSERKVLTAVETFDVKPVE